MDYIVASIICVPFYMVFDRFLHFIVYIYASCKWLLKG